MLTDSFAGDGDARTIRRAHWSSPDASSNPEFCLPMMKTRLSAYVSAGAGAGVVGGELDTRRVRHVRLGDADREDDGRRPVLAVGRLEDELVARGRRFASRAVQRQP